MKYRIIIITILVGMGLNARAQGILDDYKYIIVPKKLEAFKTVNEHQTSTLLKHLFTQKGFNAVYDDEIPDDLSSDHCLGLTAQFLDGSNMFTTKAKIALKNCKGETVYTTMEGRSKKKEYKEAFQESITEAMGSFNGMAHTYRPKNKATGPVTLNFKNDVKKLENRAPETKGPKNLDPNVTQKATEKEQLYIDRTPVPSEYTKAGPANKESLTVKRPDPEEVWYAQAVGNGFQLVDSTPKIRMRLSVSSLDGVYIAEAGNDHGIVFKEGTTWVFEYYEGDKRIQEELNIKF